MMRCGHTLTELTVALLISSVLALGLTSTMAVTMRMFPSGQSAATQSLQAVQIIDRLSTELESAIFVSERSSTSIGFTVPDRNGDGIAERVHYGWSATPNGLITRQYNGGSAVTIASGVQQFTLTPNLRSVSESFPTLGTEELSDTLLIDYSSVSGVGNNDITPTGWFGQNFKATLAPDVIAWRPTRVRFMVKRNAVPGTTLMQMRPANANIVPTTTVHEQAILNDTSLSTAYTWQEFAFTTLDPIAPEGSICLVLANQLGSKSCTVQSSSSFPGLVKTSGGDVNSWSYNTGKAIVCQLYGKRVTNDGTQQNINTNYMMSADLTLEMTSSSPNLRTSNSMLNHPELLSGFWELKFLQDPTTKDVNGDGVGDWVVNGGGALNMATIVNQVWQSSGVVLNTNPGADFAKTTIVDLRLRNTTVGGNGATFTINALRSGSTCAPVMAYLKLESDGTQTLTIWKKTADNTPVALLTVSGLSNQMVDLHLIIEPSAPLLSISVNGVQKGSFGLTKFESADGSRAATIGSNVSNAEFSYARIRVME